MAEMAQHGARWEYLASNWAEISKTFLDEVGLNWCNGRSAPKTYALMNPARGAK